MCLYVSLDSMEYKCCRANHVSLILKHHMIMCSYTLPYFAHFLYLMHTHTLTCLSDYCHAYIIWFWNIIWLCVCTLCPILHTFYIWCAHTHTHFDMFEWLLPCLYHFIDTICSLMSIWCLNYALNSVWCLIQNFYFGTNLLLIKFVFILCALFYGLCCSVLQMAPRKISAQCADKRKRMDASLFRSTQHFEQYTRHFMIAPIIQERFVNLADLKDYFILSCFAKRGWDRLLSDLPRVYDPLIWSSTPMPFYKTRL